MIFGCGDDGRIVAEILKKSGLTPVCFTKTELKEKDLQYIDGIPVKEFSHIKAEEKYYYLISSSRYRHEIYCVLINAKVSRDRIFVPGEKFPSFDRGNQYFDLFSPSDKEVYVDAGTYDGLTVDRFLEWGGCKARKVYAIEPVDEMYRRLTEKYNSDKRVSVIHGAAWKNSNDVLHFTDSGSGTTMGTTGEMSTKAVSIDDICDVPPTYIKMDIEGSEYFAIKGAEKIIKNSKPKHAICVYHKPNDMINLGRLLLKLVPEYRFWLRHYTTDVYETVLYASI
ncbi:MAG: FkbM family methyltransferase [Oribacterium sp.]|nr:FkbM family methyltransferase [Oribacterium sp.]